MMRAGSGRAGRWPDLRARWDGVASRYLVVSRRRGVLPVFELGRLAQDRPFGTHEGRVDLRGLYLDPGFLVGAGSLQSVDLSGSVLDNGRFEGQAWRDVRIESAELTNSSLFEAEFLDVEIVRSHLGGTLLASDRGWSTYVRCRFEAVRTPMAQLGNSSFLDCTFRDLKGRIEPGAAAFESCSFYGVLDDFEFRQGWPEHRLTRGPRKWRAKPGPHNTMAHVDFSNAVLSYVKFVGLDLSTVILDPERQLLVANWEPLRRMFEAEASSTAGATRDVFQTLGILGAGQDQHIVDLGFIETEFGPESRAVVAAKLAELGRRFASG